MSLLESVVTKMGKLKNVLAEAQEGVLERFCAICGHFWKGEEKLADFVDGSYFGALIRFMWSLHDHASQDRGSGQCS